MSTYPVGTIASNLVRWRRKMVRVLSRGMQLRNIQQDAGVIQDTLSVGVAYLLRGADFLVGGVLVWCEYGGLRNPPLHMLAVKRLTIPTPPNASRVQLSAG